MYSIFVNVALTNAQLFLSMKQGIAFAKQLLEVFLTGFAVAAGVSFFVFPMTSRTILLQQTTGFLSVLQGSLKVQAKYLQTLEREDVFRTNFGESSDPDTKKGAQSNIENLKVDPLKDDDSLRASTMKTMMSSLGELYGKMGGELTFAKREIAYGKLDATDLEQMFKLSRNILLPVIGMSSIADVFNRITESRGWRPMTNDQLQGNGNIEERKANEIMQWNNIMKALHNPFEIMTNAMSEGLQHVLYILELVKQPKKDDTNHDVEAKGDTAQPGDKGFATSLTKKI